MTTAERLELLKSHYDMFCEFDRDDVKVLFKVIEKQRKLIKIASTLINELPFDNGEWIEAKKEVGL